MRHYCSLADSKYLPQLLVLHQSLQKHSSEPFTLHILPMDEECAETLLQMTLPHVQLLLGFHDLPHIEAMRSNRNYREFCWSCASQLCEVLLTDFDLQEIVYLDADTCFFNDPAPIFEVIGDRSIAITPHQFPDNAEKRRLLQSGLYNVGLIYFKNNDIGRRCLKQWAADVRNRCSENVGCGDQGYLDYFERDYGKEVCILGHGINAGPWNLMAYDVTMHEGQVYLGRDPLIHYHFHEYSHGVRLTNYPLRPQDIELVYQPYIVTVEEAKAWIAPPYSPCVAI